MPNNNNTVAPASSYQQILRNMREIQENIYPVIKKLNETIFNPDPTKSDISFGEDGTMRVLGTSVVTDYKDDDEMPPCGYVRQFTSELKSTAKVGLNDTPGFSGDYLSLFTQRVSSSGPAWQLAVGSDYGTMYYRSAIDDTTWGKWTPVVDLGRMIDAPENTEVLRALLPKLFDLNEDMKKLFTHKQLFVPEDERSAHRPPADQDVGDVWLQPVDVPGALITQSIENPLETEFIHQYTSDLFPFFNLDDTLSDISWDDLTRINVETPWEIYPDDTYFISDERPHPTVDPLRDDYPTPLVLFNLDTGEYEPAFGELIGKDINTDVLTGNVVGSAIFPFNI